MPLCSLCSLLHFQCVYISSTGFCLWAIFLIASFDRCFFLDLFPCFFHGTNFSIMPSISYFKQVQHSVAVLFFSNLFQSIFARFVLISLYLPLLKLFLHCFLYAFPVFTFILKWIWLWWLEPKGSCILTLSSNSFWEDKIKSNTFPPLVGSKTCWVRKQSCVRSRNWWSSPPAL